MILRVDDLGGLVFLDGIPLPGIFRHLTVNGEILMDRGPVGKDGKSRNVPRDFKNKMCTLSLRLVPTGLGISPYAQLGQLEMMFRRVLGKKTQVFIIANEHLLVRGITRVLFTKLDSEELAGSDSINVTLSFEEFWEPSYDSK